MEKLNGKGAQVTVCHLDRIVRGRKSSFKKNKEWTTVRVSASRGSKHNCRVFLVRHPEPERSEARTVAQRSKVLLPDETKFYI